MSGRLLQQGNTHSVSSCCFTLPPATSSLPCAGNANIRVTGQKGYATTQLFKAKTLNFEALGIGGLDAQFDAIFRRAFASRVFPPSIIQRLGIQHVKVGEVWWVGVRCLVVVVDRRCTRPTH